MALEARTKKILRRSGIAAGAFLLALAGVGWLLYAKLDSNIRTDEATARALAADQGSRPNPGPRAGKAKNILLLGTDSQAGWGSTRADTAILLHLSGDRRRASMTSIPRDLMVSIPSCLSPDDGSRTRAEFAQFNWAYERAGAACTIRTFEKLSGIRVDHHLVVDFAGFMKVVDAVGGVEVDVPEPISEPEYGITLEPGRQLVKGRDALTFVRTRMGVSDGSDLQRIERQKDFMRNLVDKVTDTGTLTSPTRVYPLLDAATSSLTADSGMDSPAELYSLLKSARAIPPSALKIVTLPCTEHPDYVGRYEMVPKQGLALFKALREDAPLPAQLYNAYDKEGHRERPYFDKS
ncbi:LCP family protein [Streptomyces sp. T-3]|nr:LCP family protein [Streptomyces sp. T-3]